MSALENRIELEKRLGELDTRFANEMRKRGFDPAQADNVALPSALAKLFAEREATKAELEELIAPDQREGKRMAGEVERIRGELQRAFEGEAWHGPAVLELLRDVTAQQAAARPIADAHSIWELVLHIAAWENAGRRRLEGDRAELPDEENFPPVSDTSEAAWQQTIEELNIGHSKLYDAITGLEESRLDEPILDGMRSVYITLQGVIQHDLYHAGQIALLKKA